MNILVITLVFASVIISESSDISEKGENKLPEVVALTYNGEKHCTGIVLQDLTVLVLKACMYEDGIDIKKVKIVFPNNAKPYRIINADIDGDIVVITLDKDGNPPKCKSKITVQKCDNFGGDGTMILLHFDAWRYFIIKVAVWAFDNNENSGIREINMQHESCEDTSQSSEDLIINDKDRGSPLIIGGLLTGIYASDGFSSDEPMTFIKLSKHISFLGKYLNNSAEPKIPIEEEKIKVFHRQPTLQRMESDGIERKA